MRETPRFSRSGCVRTELSALAVIRSPYEATGNLAIFPAKVAASWFFLEHHCSPLRTSKSLIFKNLIFLAQALRKVDEKSCMVSSSELGG